MTNEEKKIHINWINSLIEAKINTFDISGVLLKNNFTFIEKNKGTFNFSIREVKKDDVILGSVVFTDNQTVFFPFIEEEKETEKKPK